MNSEELKILIEDARIKKVFHKENLQNRLVLVEVH